MEFDISNNRVRVLPGTLMLGSLREIWEEDTSPNKDEANDILNYIHVCAQIDIKAPFFSARRDEIHELAKGNVWYKRECPYNLEDLTDTIKEYQKAMDERQPEIRLVRIYNHKIDQIQDTIDGITPEIKTIEDSKGNFKGYATNLSMLTKVMRELDPILADREKLKGRIAKTAAEESSFRANKSSNLLEKRIKNQGTHGQTGQQITLPSSTTQAGATASESQPPAT